MTDDSRTTRRQTCRDCAALTSGDCGQHESHIRILRTRIVAEDSKLPRTVTIDAELLHVFITRYEMLLRVCENAHYNHNDKEALQEDRDVLARVRAAREGR